MCRVHFRNDLLKVMTWQVACAGYEGCMSDEFRDATFREGFKAVGLPQFQETAYNSFVTATLADTVTFGYYSYLKYAPQTGPQLSQ